MSDALSGNRKRITFTFGADNERNAPKLSKFADELLPRITKITAGAKVNYHDGVWRSDGNTEPPFTGEHVREPALSISFGTPHDVENVLSAVKAQIRETAQEMFDDPSFMQWVNVEIEPVSVHHFDLTEPVGSHHFERSETERAAEKYSPPAPDERSLYDGAPVSTKPPNGRTFK